MTTDLQFTLYPYQKEDIDYLKVNSGQRLHVPAGLGMSRVKKELLHDD